MQLLYAPKDIPLSIIALAALDSQIQQQVEWVPSSDVAQPILKVNDKLEFAGLPSIARFLIRTYKLVDEALPVNQRVLSVVDFLLTHDAATASTAAASAEKYLLGNDPTLADYIAWGLLHPTQQPAAYLTLVSSTAAIQKALILADEALAAAAAATASNTITEVPVVEGTSSSPDANVMDRFKNVIATELARVSGVAAALIYNSIEIPRSFEHGDLAVAVPRLRVKGNPAQFAGQWAQAFATNDYITAATAIGPFLNFRINPAILVKSTLELVSETTTDYGKNKLGAGKTVIVEFSSPNIAKPFHAGHLRSTIIGSFIRNVYDANGWKAIAMNYLGDWGKQYGLLAVGFGRFGSEEALNEDPIKHLYDVYVKINRAAEEDPSIHDEARAYFKKMEDNDESALALWRKFRDLSIVKYHEVYARLNITFDVYSGESQVSDGMARALALLRELNLLQESDGAHVIDLEAYKLGKAVIQKRDGTTLYLTRDIGAAMERYEKYKFDKMVYVVASQQELHLRQLFKTLELLKFDWASKCEHISFGMVQGMSTRKGTVVFLEDILDEAKEIMHDVMRKNEAKYKEVEDPERVADEIGLSAVKIQDNSARRIKNYDFDRNRMFTFEGDTGPYIQYAHARLASIERKSGLQVNKQANVALLTEPGAVEIVRTVAQYPDLVKGLMNGFEPCNVVTYAFKLAHDISAVFDTLWVRGAEPDVADARLLMYWAARVTLGNAMRLLGLRPLDRM